MALPNPASLLPQAQGVNGTAQYVALGGVYVILLAVGESDTWGGIAVALAWALAFTMSIEAINNVKALQASAMPAQPGPPTQAGGSGQLTPGG
jgi:hypothetical protein